MALAGKNGQVRVICNPDREGEETEDDTCLGWME